MDLFDAEINNNKERVRLLVEQGVDQGDGNGCTVLWWACHGGKLEIAQYLVEKGATLEKADNYGYTSLLVAVLYDRLEVVRYLLEQGANRDKANNDGLTPLHRAAHNDHLEIAMLLMSYGADLNASCRSILLAARRSDTPSATSPDAAWTTATSEPRSKTGTPMQQHPNQHNRKRR